MIEKHKNYTAKDLQEIYGPDWYIKLGFDKVDYPKKQKINSFEEFDQETKNIYLNIFNILKGKNPTQDFNIWACGSRVRGYWRTKEEAETMASQHNRPVKYSDYDFCTDAKNVPSNDYISGLVGVKVDRLLNDTFKVLIVV